MKKKLIIVESPTKAKTIKNFLDKKYDVVASKGHIRDLPKSSFGIKIEDGKFKPIYKIDKEHQEIVKKIKALAQKSKEIYIATDEDREGEAIGYHIAKAIGEDPQELPRIVFHEVTKKAILNALDSPRKLDVNKINAQQARRLLDRIVGYKLSPLLGSKIQKGLSAGRVQSAALKLIVDREREIKKFVPREYWSIEGEFSKSIKAVLIEYNQNKLQKFSITNSKKANEIEQELENKTYFVRKIDKIEKSIKTPPPFMTSTLQQNASTVLGFSPKKTMMIAQRLHEGVQTPFGITGVITYMRTDSLNVAKESIEERLKNEPEMQDFIGEVIVPTENVVEVVKGKKVKRTKRVFPGYILVNMIVTDKTWHFVKSVPFITGFIGKKTKPVPLTEDEANRLITSYKEGKLTAQPLVAFEIGDNVRVIDGPFVNFTGTVDEVKTDKAKLKVLVSIFGRPTPVEVDFEQVEKI